MLKYSDQQVEGDTLKVKLKDIQYNLSVTLIYRVYAAEDIIRKTAEIENGTQQVVTLESAQSGAWYLPRGGAYRLTYAAGRWAGEDQLQQEPIRQGKVVLESRRGNTSHQQIRGLPSMPEALPTNNMATSGSEPWAGAAIGRWWSKKLRFTKSVLRAGSTISISAILLKSGERLETPAYYGGFSANGFGGASRLLHRLELTGILPDREHPHVRPVLYNSWEATEFNVNEEGQKTLAEKAAKIGVERFVMDDGWFGARNNDHAGLGDWVVNKQKFPNGLKPLIQYVNGLGMDFGLWFEPEMVNPDSDLYRKHPDWAMHFQGRPRSEARNQLVLNMARDDVRRIHLRRYGQNLSENNIKFIKWDMNRHFSEPGWPEIPIPEQKEIWVKYVRNVYDIMDKLRAKHPGLEIESCSGGGGRVDLGVLKRVDEVWTSDNTEAFDRLKIQEGFTTPIRRK